MNELFKSFDALKSAYDALGGLQRSAADKREVVTAIRDFVKTAADAGTFIGAPDQRRSAQDMLDYWFTQLLVSSDDEMDIVSPRLADYRPAAGQTQGEGEPAAGDSEASSEFERNRQIIRLGALARQWRHNDGAKGYLLKGAALDDAKKYRNEDPDIAKLVAASEREERKVQNTWITILAIVAIAFATLAGFAFYKAQTATAAAELALVEQERAEDEKAKADAQRRLAEAAAKASEESRQNAERLAEQTKADSEVLRKQFADLQKQQGALDAAIEIIRRQLKLGALARSDLPEVIANLIKPEQVDNIFSDPSKLAGYNPDFLGVTIDPPALSDADRQSAFEDGRLLGYINYSVVLNQRRRMAFYTAVNLDRDSLRVLPRVNLRGLSPASPDPRVPPELQASDGWFERPDIDIGHLAARAEISWGPAFPEGATAAAQILNDALNVSTNITPQFHSFNRGVWAALERWTLTEHNPQARQVTVFSGPVFSSDDPDIAGALVPRAFWKVAVSAVSNYNQSIDGGYAVDAFLIRQFKAGTDEKVEQTTSFDPDDYRVPVAEIERLTGLRFAEIIRSTDQLSHPAIIAETRGDALAAKVAMLDGPDAAERRAVAQELVSALRDGALPWSEQRKVISALLEMAQGSSMEKLKASGRLNVLFVLAEVPEATWNGEQAIDMKALARHAVADLETRAEAGQTEIGSQTREPIERLEVNVGYGTKSAQTVFLQFAGLTRGEANEISTRMQQLGWVIPGEERVKEVSGNAVRYNPGAAADKAAAELLAADLRAAGRTTVTAAENTLVAPGSLEIWLSE